jgi:ribosomal protein S18 acetylase RimI-like enzyme
MLKSAIRQSLEVIERLNDLIKIREGFPRDDIIWINTVTFHPEYQAQGYGPELMKGLIEIVEGLESHTRMRTYVNLNNWPSLRLYMKVGFDKMVKIAGNKVYTDKAEAHVLVE